MEKRILAEFPEVATVVSKTGRAEISEDPMGPEQTDFFIMLKPQKQWKTGRTKADLIEAMNKELSAIPGIRLSFSQPIALRVNELISGVKSDLAVKVYGTDLEKLKEYADRIAGELAASTAPRMSRWNRSPAWSRLRSLTTAGNGPYGINVADVNEVIETALAGREATRVVEGQMRIATVVDFPRMIVRTLTPLKGLLIPGAGGEPRPPDRWRRSSLVEGPAQITREKGMRRVAAEVNIRGRDLGGFVAETQEKRWPASKRNCRRVIFWNTAASLKISSGPCRRLSIVVPQRSC